MKTENYKAVKDLIDDIEVLSKFYNAMQKTDPPSTVITIEALGIEKISFVDSRIYFLILDFVRTELLAKKAAFEAL